MMTYSFASKLMLRFWDSSVGAIVSPSLNASRTGNATLHRTDSLQAHTLCRDSDTEDVVNENTLTRRPS